MKANLQYSNTFSKQVFRNKILDRHLPPKSKDSLSFKGITSALNKEIVKNVDSRITGVLNGRFGTMLDEFSKLAQETKLGQAITKTSDSTDVISYKFTERSLLGKTVDNFTYFLKGLWLDIANGFLGRLNKNKNIADNDFFKRIYNSKVLRNQRNTNKANELFYSILGMTNKHQELINNAGEALKSGKTDIDNLYKDFVSSSINKPMGAYSAKSERALNRLVTGTISAGFVGRDFYNLTMYQTNDEQKAKKSQKKRFKQEITRIGVSAFLSFSALGILSKFTNSSLKAAVLVTGATTLISEVTSRLKNGVSLIPLTPKKAKEIHDKKANDIAYKGQETKKDNPIQAPVKNKFNDINLFIESVGGKPQAAKQNDKNASIPGNQDEKANKNNSVLVKLAKVLGAALAIAFGWDMISKYGIKNAKKVMSQSNNKVLKFMANFKDNVIFKDRKVPKEIMDSIIDALREKGNKGLAESFAKNLGELDKNSCYTIGKIDRKLAIPLRIPEKVMDAIKMPYNGLCRLLKNTPFKHTPAWLEKGETTEADKIKKAIGVLYDEISRKKISKNDIPRVVEDRINSIFNDNSFIQYNQADLALLNRTLVTTIASYFFINDFRNQVLIDSAGNDTKRAEEVTNERLGHKLTNFVTNAFWMNFFNTTFSKTVMGSLLGAATVAAATEISNESTVRYSIGVPIKKMGSKEAIQEFEAKNYYNQGLYGKWIRFFSKLTGKKPISEKAKKQ